MVAHPPTQSHKWLGVVSPTSLHLCGGPSLFGPTSGWEWQTLAIPGPQPDPQVVWWAPKSWTTSQVRGSGSLLLVLKVAEEVTQPPTGLNAYLPHGSNEKKGEWGDLRVSYCKGQVEPKQVAKRSH